MSSRYVRGGDALSLVLTLCHAISITVILCAESAYIHLMCFMGVNDDSLLQSREVSVADIIELFRELSILTVTMLNIGLCVSSLSSPAKDGYKSIIIEGK